MGNRPEELRRALDSVRAQRGEPIEIVVVGNGADVPDLDDDVTYLRLPENVGLPEGRNRGADKTTGDVVLFLDDDGWYPTDDLAEWVRARFATDPRLGVLSFRIVDEDGNSARRHVPRLRAGDPLRSGAVTTFLGGASAIRRETIDRIGGLPGDFFWAHEETDFAWRALDAGYGIEYDARAVMAHPRTSPARHANYYRMNARNRVWLAKRNLPVPLAVAYVGDWLALTVVRERSMTALRPWFRGFAEGLRTPAGRRRPMRWRTAWRMAKLGRPPVV
ncbi:MAG: glycosyltransferase [Streptosporangiales bacterium]|nr:glycosyltransferase [Streptosporangiales bacterium]